MAGGDRLFISGTADSVIEALRQARREEFCTFAGANGTVHVNPDQVAYVQDDDAAA